MKMKMMKPSATLLLMNLSILFILTLTASSQNNFKCNSTSTSTSTCESLVDYVSPNSTTLSQIATLFGIKNLRSILGANSLPLNTPPTRPISAKEKIKIPFPCICINGTGISNKLPVYKVKKDDGLDHIARDIFAGLVTYQQIAAVPANNISNPNLIEPGQEFWIPLPCSCDQVNGSSVVHYGYVVENGNSVEQIADKYGTSEQTLLSLNGISDPSKLQAGNLLDVPLIACSTEIRRDSMDYPLLVPNGTYTITANDCVQCKCKSSNNWTLHCEPSPKDQFPQCPSTQCQGSDKNSDSIPLGNSSNPLVQVSSSSYGCNRNVCSYAGYRNQTIFTTLVKTPCDVLRPSNRVSRIGLQGSRCWWFIISLGSLLISALLM